jgi:3-oxoacyl-[acyl-carrier-protein] synthase III
MAFATLNNVRFAGLATCVPSWKLSNLTDCAPEDRSERQRLVRNIGIETRRICKPWQCFSDLAFEAAEALIERLGWQRDEIDAVICVTQSPDYLIPSTAIILQDRLKLSHSTIAFDVNLGCSGYPFGLHLVGSMIASGGVRKALVLVGDRCASLDGPLFSDAGTATALEYSPGAPPMHFDLNSDGSGFRAIMLPVGGHREPVAPQHLMPTRNAEGKWHREYDLILDGTAVLNFSTQQIPPAVNRILDKTAHTSADIDYFIFHQANKMINETIRRKLQLPVEKVPSTLHDFGNTSGASLPVTMTVRLAEALAQKRHRVLLTGFGIGLSWGSCLLDTEGAAWLPLIEASA